MANRVNSFNVQGNTYGVEADLTFDSSPTIGSSNPVTSDGIAQAIQSVTLGDSISYGRTDGTPVGYCSISYGENNSATCNYGVSIGRNNVNGGYCGLTIGDSNAVVGSIYGLAAGQGNSCLGTANVAIGWGCQAGTKIGNFSTNPPAEPDYNAKVFIGYVNISSKKIYYDPNMENQITVSISTREGCYFVDKTEGQPNRAPGDIYEYKRTANYTYTLTKIASQYAWFSNRCSSRVYIYRGPSYYDVANDRNYLNYSDGTFSNDIESLLSSEKARTGDLFFDIISGNFVTYVYDLNTIGDVTKIHWLKVKVYKADSTTGDKPRVSRSFIFNQAGTCAYVYIDDADRSKKYRVYSRPDFGDDSDITNTIVDGQTIIAMSNPSSTAGGTGLYYVCDIDGVPRVARSWISNGSYPDSYWNSGACCKSSGTVVLGLDSKTSGGNYGSIICGNGCTAVGATEGLAIFGLFNTVEMGNSFGGQCGSLIAGWNITLKSHNGLSNAAFAFGKDININGDAFSGSNRWYVMGDNINVNNRCGGYNNFIFGSYLNIDTTTQTMVLGHNQYINDLQYAYTYGYGNGVYGIPKTILTKDKSGIWTGTGVTYDASTGTYSFPQDKLFMLRGIPSEYSRYNFDYDRTEVGFLGYAKSTDGTTLTSVTGSIPLAAAYPTVIGIMNTYKIDTNISPFDITHSGYCTIFGYSNTMQYRNNYYGINAYGSFLDISGDINQYSMFLGAYNTMTGTTGAMFTVGIGNDSTRKNGFVIFDSGVMAAPSSPDTITGGTSAMATTGLNSDKMVVTYGMMKDYTGPGGGGSSRPHVGTVTLAAADWDGSTFEQTVSLTGMTAGAIVIVQPIGSPQQFNYHNVYLDSQGADELTFKCTTTPTLDISVKVVYWP